jgi:hypothetical protein
MELLWLAATSHFLPRTIFVAGLFLSGERLDRIEREEVG